MLNEIKGVKGTINELISKIEAIKEQLYNKINELPDNDNIKRLEGKPNCFIINVSQLMGKPFSVEYHDYKMQYKCIVEYLKNCNIENFESNLQQMINTGYLKQNGRSTLLNPEVIRYLKTII